MAISNVRRLLVVCNGSDSYSDSWIFATSTMNEASDENRLDPVLRQVSTADGEKMI